jgi:hypothetical protein
MAREIEQRQIRPARRADEAVRSPVQRKSVAVKHLGDLEAEIAQPVRDCAGVTLRIAQRIDGLVFGVADHERDSPLGERRLGHHNDQRRERQRDRAQARYRPAKPGRPHAPHPFRHVAARIAPATPTP